MPCGASIPSGAPAKLLRVLTTRHPRITGWPAPSTAADLLARRGLVLKRRRRRHPQHPGVVPPTTTAPNDLWTADFKGQFRTGNGVYCYPLTIADQHTRFLLTCHGLLSTQTVTARPVFERAFRDVRPAAGHPHRQRRPLRHPGDPRAVLPERLVDAPRDPASAHPPRAAAAERRARADAPHAQAPGDPPRAARPVPCNSAPSTPSGRSTTRSGRTRRCSRTRPRPATTRRRGRIRPACPRPSIPATSS